jgi:hypothetical protein
MHPNPESFVLSQMWGNLTHRLYNLTLIYRLMDNNSVVNHLPLDFMTSKSRVLNL